MRRGERFISIIALLAACSSPSEPQAVQSSSLPEGVVARVGRDLVSSASVGRIARSRGIPPSQALLLAASDALLAEEARSWSPAGIASSIDRAAVARGLLEQLGREAVRLGPPNEAEIAEVVRERWVEIARPEGVRTTHAVVINDKPERATDARRIAENVAIAVRSATNSEEFQRLAKDVPLEGLELRAEALPFLTADGRSFEKREGALLSRGPFDPDFCRAASALASPGEQSPVVQTKFGFHVIRLEERFASNIVPQDKLPGLLTPEVMTRRAARARHDLLEKLRRGVGIELDRGHDELTARAKAEP